MAAVHPVYIYFLLRGGVLIYVGQTVDLHGRIRTHRDIRQFDRVMYTVVAPEDADDVEHRYITSLKPTENILRSPAKKRGRQKMVINRGWLPPTAHTDEAIAFCSAVNDPAYQRLPWVMAYRRSLPRVPRGGAV